MDTTRCLDIGCGAHPDFLPAEVQIGLDIDFESLQQSRKRFPKAHFVCGDGERLPFSDGAFDSIVSKVTLPVMNWNTAIPEISRVLKPEGCISFNLHPFGYAWWDLMRRLRGGNLRSIMGGVWIIVNGFILHLFGKTYRLPFSRRCYDSFQTFSGVRRVLRKQGFHGGIFEWYTIKAYKSGAQSMRSFDEDQRR